MKRLFGLDLLDRLLLACGGFGTVGFVLIYPPAAFLFLAAFSGAMAVLVDRRTPPVVIEPEVKS